MTTVLTVELPKLRVAEVIISVSIVLRALLTMSEIEIIIVCGVVGVREPLARVFQRMSTLSEGTAFVVTGNCDVKNAPFEIVVILF